MTSFRRFRSSWTGVTRNAKRPLNHEDDPRRITPSARDNSMMSFLNADLVAENSIGAPPVGVVHKDGNVWQILRFGVSAEEQSTEVFATRRDAGARLMALASRA